MAHIGRRLIGMTVILIVLGGCSSCTSNSGSGGQKNQPSLMATYCFDDSVGTQQFTMHVTFSGEAAATATGSGLKKFSQVESGQFMPPSGHECVTSKVFNLQNGKWKVTGTPDAIAASLSCDANVPGILTLDVSGNGPRCS